MKNWWAYLSEYDVFVSANGEIKGSDLKTKNTYRKYQSKEDTYLKVGVKHNEVAKKVYVHRLVAIAFIPNPENKPQVNHKNGIKSDNRVENLEWCTAEENMDHARVNKYFKPITQKPNAKMGRLTESQVIQIRSSKGITDAQYAQMFSVNQYTIRSARRGKTWKHLNNIAS